MPIGSPKQKIINLGIETYFSFNNMHQIKKQSIPLRKNGWKNEMYGDVLIYDMWHAFRYYEIWVDFGDFCLNSLSF